VANLPYYSTDDDTTNLNLASGPDILPTDGWTLLYRSFGNSSCGVKMPYFILYNRFNGILRLFFHDDVSSDTFTSGKVILSIVSGGTTQVTSAPLLSFDGGDINKPLVTLNKVTPGFWSYADFSLAVFDPNPIKDATLQFAINGVNTYDLTISGGLTLDQVENASHASGTIDPVGAIKAADSNFRTVSSAKNDLKGLIFDSKSNKAINTNKWWYSGVSTVVNSLSIVSGLSALAGLVDSFIGGGKSQAPPLHFQGQVQLNGTMTSESSLGEIIMRVPGAPHSSQTDDALPFSDVPLGVFNASIPEIDSYFENNGCIEITCITQDGKVYQSETPLVVQFNPNALSGATAYVSWGWTFDTRGPSYVPEVLVTSSTMSFDLGGRFDIDPSGVTVKIRIVPASAPLEQDPIVVMKTYSVLVNFLGIQ
jgi:hypothetical protein